MPVSYHGVFGPGEKTFSGCVNTRIVGIVEEQGSDSGRGHNQRNVVTSRQGRRLPPTRSRPAPSSRYFCFVSPLAAT